MDVNYKHKLIWYLISTTLGLMSLMLFFNKSVQSLFTDFNKHNERYVLSKIETTKLNSQMKLTLIKLKQNQRFFLEIYGHLNHGLELIEKLSLEGEFDAHLILNNQTSNLIITNIDRSDDYEIVAPTYNRQMKPVLNVFKYDPILEEFKKVNSKPIL